MSLNSRMYNCNILFLLIGGSHNLLLWDTTKLQMASINNMISSGVNFLENI